MRSSVWKILFFFAAVFLFTGCGPKLVKGPAETLSGSVPDSLKAKFSIETLDSAEGSHKLSAVLFAVPYKRYRLEISGPMGLGIASLLWHDGEWTLLLPTQKAYASGKGYLVGGYAGIPRFDIHRIAALFWGEFLPRNATVDSVKTESGPDSSKVVLTFGKNALGISFRMESGPDGRVRELLQGGERLEFSSAAEFDVGVLPSEVRAFRNGKNVLNIRIKNVRSDASFGGGTWRLSVPERYQRL